MRNGLKTNQSALRKYGKSAARMCAILAVSSALATTSLGGASAQPITNDPTATEQPTTTSAALPPVESAVPEMLEPEILEPETEESQPSAARAAQQTMRNRATGMCLDDSSYGLRAFSCNGLIYQRWNTLPFDFYLYDIQNASTARCLDDSNLGLRTLGCNGGTFQKFTIQGSGGNGNAIQSLGTNRCLDHSGLGLRTVVCNGGQYQKWDF